MPVNETSSNADRTAGAHKLFVNASSVKSAACAKGDVNQEERPSGFGGCPVSQEAVNGVGEGKAGLSQHRAASNIPVAGGSLPGHQETKSDVWMYPSENQFFNAMKKKGWKPQEKDMGTVVAIHNAVNERAWREVMRWEEMHQSECGAPKLKNFRGRPNEFSPKARLLNYLGYKLPFDRHDWVVDRCGREVRYIIDFYNAAPLPDMPVAMHLDVRPALDSFQGAWDRIKMQCRWMSSGRWRYE
ncbi:hypothetical protein BSKO_11107 [Bryopsis sp. KO-2023]|nr:hypothetical protein BSKO_11107 [Bryopsis sp. KO-2023]